MLQKLCSVGIAAMLACSTLAMGVGPAAAQGFRHQHSSHYTHHGHGFAGRSHYRGNRHYYYHGGHRYYGYGYGYDDYDYGGAVAAGIIGLAAGAIAAGAINSSRGVGYCERHFRSYNPRTGLYRGYDGRYHPCP